MVSCGQAWPPNGWEITDRQFRRLLERYRQEGSSGLVSLAGAVELSHW